jgi:hypothetical protein
MYKCIRTLGWIFPPLQHFLIHLTCMRK